MNIDKYRLISYVAVKMYSTAIVEVEAPRDSHVHEPYK